MNQSKQAIPSNPQFELHQEYLAARVQIDQTADFFERQRRQR